MARHFLTCVAFLSVTTLATPLHAVAAEQAPAAGAAAPELAPPAEFKARAAELLLIFNGERKPSASFSQAAMAKGKVSVEQLDERLGKFTSQARGRFGRAERVVEVLAIGPHQGIVVLECKDEELAVKMTLEPAAPHAMTGISAGPAVNLEAGVLRQASTSSPLPAKR